MAQPPTRLVGLSYPKDLLVNLTLRELRGKYKRSVLGWAWSVINPATTIVVYAVVFSFFLRVAPPVGDPSGLNTYAFYLMTGLLPFLFLNAGVMGAVSSLTSNESLIKKVYFPRSVLPASAVLATLTSFAVELGVLVVLLAFAGNIVLPWLPVLVAIVAIHAVFVLGLGLLISPLNAYFRDIEHFTLIFLNVWFWGTPVLYPESVLHETNPDGSMGAAKEAGGIVVADVMNLNPMAHFARAYRSALYDLRMPSTTTWLAMLAAASVALLLGVLVFRRLEPNLAEEL